jgi:hypothetical protein
MVGLVDCFRHRRVNIVWSGDHGWFNYSDVRIVTFGLLCDTLTETILVVAGPLKFSDDQPPLLWLDAEAVM